MKPRLSKILKLLQTKPYILYARLGGSHAHTDLNCPMLRGDEFRLLRYKEISVDEAQKRRLTPCACMERMVENGV